MKGDRSRRFASASPSRRLRPLERGRLWWTTLTFGARHPGRRVGALAGLGLVAGLGEAAVVVLLVALASRSSSGRLPFLEGLPSDAWTLAGMALGALVLLALAHYGSAWISTHAAADVQRAVQGRLVSAYLNAPGPAQARVPVGELQDFVTVCSRVLAHVTH